MGDNLKSEGFKMKPLFKKIISTIFAGILIVVGLWTVILQVGAIVTRVDMPENPPFSMWFMIVMGLLIGLIMIYSGIKLAMKK